jgi:hypothetical protein
VPAGHAVQRQLTVGGAAVTVDRIVRPSAYKTRLNEIVTTEARAAGFTPERVRRQLVEMTAVGEHVHQTKREAVLAALELVKDDAWERLKTRQDVVYRMPPLAEADARRIVTDIEKADPNALQGLQLAGTAFTPIATGDERKHEWGILKARTRADECMLISGAATGVSWGPFLNCGIGIAHSHPYFEAGKTRNRFGGIRLETKEIADHPNLPAGMIAWNDLATRAELSEVSKIFPSASDIEFAADQNVPLHRVYTPYAVVQGNGVDYVANPDIRGGQFRAAPRLVFVILGARPAPDGANYTCTLEAKSGATTLWSSVVTTEGTGQFGLLRW